MTFSICEMVGAEIIASESSGGNTLTNHVMRSATLADLPQPFADLTATRGLFRKSSAICTCLEYHRLSSTSDSHACGSVR